MTAPHVRKDGGVAFIENVKHCWWRRRRRHDVDRLASADFDLPRVCATARQRWRDAPFVRAENIAASDAATAVEDADDVTPS